MGFPEDMCSPGSGEVLMYDTGTCVLNSFLHLSSDREEHHRTGSPPDVMLSPNSDVFYSKQQIIYMQEFVAATIKSIIIKIDYQYFMKQAHILLTRICSICLMLYEV